MPNPDPYRVLGIGRSASEADIKKAYRKLARRHHPDVNRNSKASEDRFKEIQEAYELLSDKQRREYYDTYGHDAIHNDFQSYGRGGETLREQGHRPRRVQVQIWRLPRRWE